MEEEIAVLIVEDNDSYRMELEIMLEEHNYLIWLSTASAIDALNKLEAATKLPDVLVLDVRLKEQMDGIKLAKLLAPNKIPFIYMTAFPGEAQFRNAMETFPSAYLLKPVKPLELHHAIQLAIHTHSKSSPSSSTDQSTENLTLILKNKNNLPRRVPVDHIYALHSHGNFVFFYTFSSEDRYSLKISLSKMEEKLTDHGFIRIHRKYLISTAFWKKKLPLGNEIVVGGKKFSIGRAYRKNLLPYLLLNDSDE